MAQQVSPTDGSRLGIAHARTCEIMPFRRLFGSALLGASLATVHVTGSLSGHEAAHFVAWLLAVPFLDTVATAYQSRPRGVRQRRAASQDLRSLLLACGYSPAQGRWIRTAICVQCALAGLALWYARAPGWVSVVGLTLLSGLYLFWFTRRQQALEQASTPDWAGKGPNRCNSTFPQEK